MPLSRKTLVTMTRECAFPYAGETVNLRYYPAALGSEGIATANRLRAELAAAGESGDDAAAEKALLATGAWLCTIIAWWDVTEDESDTMLAITPENLASLTANFPEFIQACISACQNDRAQGNANGTPPSAPSAATSLPTGNSALMAASLTPSASSSLPDGSTVPLQ
jgi:hypothetical protein